MMKSKSFSLYQLKERSQTVSLDLERGDKAKIEE